MLARYTLTAPLRDNAGRVAPPVRRYPEGQHLPTYAEHARELVLGSFDGATVVRGYGYWKSPETGEEYEEPVAIWTIDAPADVASARELARIAGELGAYAAQEAVYVTALDARGFRTALVPGGDFDSDQARAAAELVGGPVPVSDNVNAAPAA